jgi:toxoflavin biosynthesis protein ToxD
MEYKKDVKSEADEDQNRDLPVKIPVMIQIPAGSFWMGTSEQQVKYLLEKEDWASEWFNSDLFTVEQPQHQVTLPSYEIAQFPVTNSEYYSFIYNAGYRVPKHWFGFRYMDGLDDHPVTNVSRTDAEAYCQWLSKSTGVTYRLPSEAEWEKAARGMEQRIYPWGDNFDPWRCNTIESGKKQTTRVGSYSPGGDSPFDVADMVGNVWEWTRSIMQPYPYKNDDGRESAPGPGSKIVIRGGAWYYSRAMARCSSREGLLVDYISPAIGFRLVRNT